MYRTFVSNVITLKEVFNKLTASIPVETEGLKENLDAPTTLIEAAVLTDKNFIPEGLPREHEDTSKHRRSRRCQQNHSG